MTKKEKIGLDLIYGNAGKRLVYEKYKNTNPEIETLCVYAESFFSQKY
jgi:hypothetical protein